jgi:hypothetical protein
MQMSRLELLLAAFLIKNCANRLCWRKEFFLIPREKFFKEKSFLLHPVGRSASEKHYFCHFPFPPLCLPFVRWKLINFIAIQHSLRKAGTGRA